MKGKLSMHQENKGPKYFFKKEYNMETEFNWKNCMKKFHQKRFCWLKER